MEPPHKKHKADSDEEDEVASLEQQLDEAFSRKDYDAAKKISSQLREVLKRQTQRYQQKQRCGRK